MVHEEGAPKIVLQHKAAFQSSNVQVELGNSQINEGVYYRWFYKTPMIITCNDWHSFVLGENLMTSSGLIETPSCKHVTQIRCIEISTLSISACIACVWISQAIRTSLENMEQNSSKNVCVDCFILNWLLTSMANTRRRTIRVAHTWMQRW